MATLHVDGVCGTQVARAGRSETCRAAAKLTDAPGLKGSLDLAAQEAPPPLERWLIDHGAPEQLVHLQETEVDGSPIDVTVAARDIAAGETVLRIPDELVVTLDRVFEDDTVAEVLTTDKLSELACLTLYLMCARTAHSHVHILQPWVCAQVCRRVRFPPAPRRLHSPRSCQNMVPGMHVLAKTCGESCAGMRRSAATRVNGIHSSRS